MKIAITDTCIFIDLHELKLTNIFFSLNIEVHTTQDVIQELYSDQESLLRLKEQSGFLKIHSITDEERTLIQALNLPKGLSETDKTVVFLAEKANAFILSSDNLIRKVAKERSIQRHGLIWIFDQLVEQHQLTCREARQKLTDLKSMNLMYYNNSKLDIEIEMRLQKWLE